MAKKIKSFTVDVEAYEGLMGILKESEIDPSVSFFLDKLIKELLNYLKTVKEGLSQSALHTVPFSFIVNSIATTPTFRIFEDEPASGEAKSSLSDELDTWQKKYEEQTRKELRLNVDPVLYDEVSEAARKYGVQDGMSFFFKVMLERAKKGGDLDDDEYRAVVMSMGEGFDEYRKQKIRPAFDKIDDKLDRILKPLGLKIDREEDKK